MKTRRSKLRGVYRKVGLRADPTESRLLKEPSMPKPVTVQAPGNDTRRDSFKAGSHITSSLI